MATLGTSLWPALAHGREQAAPRPVAAPQAASVPAVTGRLRVARPEAIVWRPGFRVRALVAREGAEFDVASRQGAWYEVVLPATRQTPRMIAYIAVADVKVVRGTATARTAPPAQAALVRGRRARLDGRGHGFASMLAGYRSGASTITIDESSIVNLEPSTTHASVAVRSGTMFDVSGGAWLTPRFGVSVGVAFSSSKGTASLSGSVPHPFFFNRPRTYAGDQGGAAHREIATDIDVVWALPIKHRIHSVVSAGPTLFQVSQDLVNVPTLADLFPYDALTFTSATFTRPSASAVGFNVGAEASYALTSQIGAALGVRVRRGSVDVANARGITVGVDVGGVTAGVGLHIRF